MKSEDGSIYFYTQKIYKCKKHGEIGCDTVYFQGCEKRWCKKCFIDFLDSNLCTAEEISN